MRVLSRPSTLATLFPSLPLFTLKTPLVRMRPMGYTPPGYGGVDGGISRMTGASDGSVRTRLCLIFQIVLLVR